MAGVKYTALGQKKKKYKQLFWHALVKQAIWTHLYQFHAYPLKQYLFKSRKFYDNRLQLSACHATLTRAGNWWNWSAEIGVIVRHGSLNWTIALHFDRRFTALDAKYGLRVSSQPKQWIKSYAGMSSSWTDSFFYNNCNCLSCRVINVIQKFWWTMVCLFGNLAGQWRSPQVETLPRIL